MVNSYYYDNKSKLQPAFLRRDIGSIGIILAFPSCSKDAIENAR